MKTTTEHFVIQEPPIFHPTPQPLKEEALKITNTTTMSKEAGWRYRDMILRVGGSQSEMKTLRDYLGCEPTTRPYLEWLGARPRHT